MADSASKERADPSALREVGAAMTHGSREIAAEARSAANHIACEQRDALADYVAALADAASRGAESLQASGYARSAASVQRTADDVGAFAVRLQEREPGELWANVEEFSQDHLALTFGAGFALAFGLTRFLTSSSVPHEPDAEGDESGGSH